MSADMYMDCPRCNGRNTVRIDCTDDLDLHEDGRITSDVQGHCTACDMEFAGVSA